MKDLKRTEVDNFKLENAVTIENIVNSEKDIISIEKVFENKKEIKLNKKDLKLFLNGVQLNMDELDDTYRIYQDNNFIGLGIVKNKKLKRDIIIN